MQSTHTLSMLLAMALISAMGSAKAGPDEGLYDPAPPEGSAFIRFINDLPEDGSEPVAANGRTLDYLDYKETSSYFVVEQGDAQAQIGDQYESFQAEAGQFYTAILTDDGHVIINQDMAADDRAKALISFYNLTDSQALSLKTADGAVEVIPATPPNEAGEQQINPVKVSLGIYNGDQLVKDLGAVSLDRSKSYAVVAFNENDVEWVQSTTNTTR